MKFECVAVVNGSNVGWDVFYSVSSQADGPTVIFAFEIGHDTMCIWIVVSEEEVAQSGSVTMQPVDFLKEAFDGQLTLTFEWADRGLFVKFSGFCIGRRLVHWKGMEESKP